MASDTAFLDIFVQCVRAINGHKLIERESRQDKEFHFQNWFKARLVETGIHYEMGGRNSYPDFRLVATPVGFEVKGLAYPGRESTYDSNSQVPSGSYNGRTIFYVFGRYPAQLDGNTYPVLDLVLCHGDFLNADHEYVHQNKSVKGFGSYGDIIIRDRKMYVAPTPYSLTTGTAHNCTLIVPAETEVDARLVRIGDLIRHETDKLIIGYAFDLRTNELRPELVDNPDVKREHMFRAFRVAGSPEEPVEMRSLTDASGMLMSDEPDDDR